MVSGGDLTSVILVSVLFIPLVIVFFEKFLQPNDNITGVNGRIDMLQLFVRQQ